MGQRYQELSDKHIEFIAQQKLFFVGTATADSRERLAQGHGHLPGARQPARRVAQSNRQR